jgi:hypothetical protein
LNSAVLRKQKNSTSPSCLQFSLETFAFTPISLQPSLSIQKTITHLDNLLSCTLSNPSSNRLTRNGQVKEEEGFEEVEEDSLVSWQRDQ